LKNNMIRKTLILLITIAIVTLCGCSDAKELSDYEQGIAALEEQNYSEALSCFVRAQESGHNKQLVYRGEGMAYLGLGDYENAMNAFSNALSESNGLLKKVDYDINYYMAVAEVKSGNLDAAINTYTNIIALDKNGSDAYYLRGKVYLEKGSIDDAKSDYDMAIEKNKNDSQLYVNIYEDLAGAGLETDAKTYINKGVANVAKPTKYELGIFNYYLGDYTQARNYFEEASETKKTEAGIVYLGKTYQALDDSEYAAALYDEFTNNNKTAAIVYNELGILKAQKKDYEGALAAFEAGLQVEDSSCRQTLMYNRIVANEFLGNFSVAASQIKEYLSFYPGDEKAVRENIFLSSR